jgi:ribosomal protein L37AE/L43A
MKNSELIERQREVELANDDEWRVAPCPFCGSEPVTREFSLYIGVKCDTCGTGWMMLGNWNERIPSPQSSRESQPTEGRASAEGETCLPNIDTQRVEGKD